MTRLLVLLTAATVALLATLALGACGSGSAEVEAYINDLRPAFETFVDANNSGAEAMTVMKTGDSSQLEQFQSDWSDFVAGYREASRLMNMMDVPSGLQAAHSNWIQCIDLQADSADEFQTQLKRYLARGNASQQAQSKLNDLFAQVQSDQLLVVDAMRTWSKALDEEGGASVPDWLKQLEARVQYQTTPPQ